jgi:hypothetical protein
MTATDIEAVTTAPAATTAERARAGTARIQAVATEATAVTLPDG